MVDFSKWFSKRRWNDPNSTVYCKNSVVVSPSLGKWLHSNCRTGASCYYIRLAECSWLHVNSSFLSHKFFKKLKDMWISYHFQRIHCLNGPQLIKYQLSILNWTFETTIAMTSPRRSCCLSTGPPTEPKRIASLEPKTGIKKQNEQKHRKKLLMGFNSFANWWSKLLWVPVLEHGTSHILLHFARESRARISEKMTTFPFCHDYRCLPLKEEPYTLRQEHTPANHFDMIGSHR